MRLAGRVCVSMLGTPAVHTTRSADRRPLTMHLLAGSDLAHIVHGQVRRRHDERNDVVSFVRLLAGMPDLWMRTLREHRSDQYGKCLSCRSADGHADWPCLPRRLAEDAEQTSKTLNWAVDVSERTDPGSNWPAHRRGAR